MTLELIPLFPTQTEAAIYTRLAQWANEGLAPGDANWVDSREGSMFWIFMRPLARELATLYDRAGTEVPAAGHPLYAWSTYLDDVALVYGLERLPATAAGGVVRFTGTAGGEIIATGTVVGVVPAGEDTPQPTYIVGAGATLPAPLASPTGVVATPVVGGGTFPAGTYYWKVAAIKGTTETLPSAEVSTAVALNGRATITWNAVAGATGYKVYRSLTAGGQNVSPALLVTLGAVLTHDDTGTAPGAGVVALINSTAYVDLTVSATDPGVEGNVAASAVVEGITPLDATVTLINALPMVGGTDTETDEAFRARLLGSFRSTGAGTRADYKRWALAWPGVGRATVLPVWNGPGTVKVIITTAAGQPVSAATVTALQLYFDPTPGLGAGAAPIGHIVTVETATTLNITITATLVLDAAYSLDGASGTVALRVALEASLRAYLETVEPGGSVIISQIIGRLVEVTGVIDVSAVTVNGAAVNLVIPSAPPRVPILLTFTPTVL